MGFGAFRSVRQFWHHPLQSPGRCCVLGSWRGTIAEIRCCRKLSAPPKPKISPSSHLFFRDIPRIPATMESLKALTANLLQYHHLIETALCFFRRRVPGCIRNPALTSGILRDALLASFRFFIQISSVFFHFSLIAPLSRNSRRFLVPCIFVCYDFYVRNFFTGIFQNSRNTIKSSKARTADFFRAMAAGQVRLLPGIEDA